MRACAFVFGSRAFVFGSHACVCGCVLMCVYVTEHCLGIINADAALFYLFLDIFYIFSSYVILSVRVTTAGTWQKRFAHTMFPK